MRDLDGRTLGHYHIVEKIGEGGMGVVYRAHDQRLDRDVAIKVLPEEVAHDPDRLARFDREAKAVAKLDHQNILAIHDFGRHDGLTYLITELLEGQSLRHRIPLGGIGWHKTAEICAAVADGLAAAHGKGVIHRDLKPENIFLCSDGRVKVLDFGLAQIKEPVEEEAETASLTPGATSPGTIMGTAGYMSPEQVRGEPADERSDIFALGCVMYETFTGQGAFAGDTAAEVMASILKEEPKDLSASGMELPIEASRTIRRCLEKSPDARFQSAFDLAYNLRSITTDHAVLTETAPTPAQPKSRPTAAAVLAAATVLIAIGITAWFARPTISTAPPTTDLPRVVVLPFVNLGPADDEYFADGMTDEVRGKLAGLAGLEVIARDSSDFYRDATKTPRQIADELGVRYLLTGTVRWQKPLDGPSRIRLSSELVDALPGRSPVAMWHDSFDATLADVFEVQADIATKVVRALGVALGTHERQSLDQRPTDNLEAYELYIKAERISGEALGGSLLRYNRMAELYRQAVDLDPEFGPAWAGLSKAQSYIFRLSRGTQEQSEAARASAERALALDPSLAEVRLAMARYFKEVRQDSIKASEQVELGLETSPNHAGLLRERARISRLDRDRWDEALEDLRRSAALDPLSSRAATDLGWHLLYMRRDAEAEEALDRALSISPNSFRAIRLSAMVMLARGDLEGARVFLGATSNNLDRDEFIAQLAVFDDLYWVLDDQWQKELLGLGLEPFGGSVSDRSLAFAHTYHLRGDREQTVTFAEQVRAALADELENFPDDPDANPLMGVALAYLGRRDEALTFGRKGMQLYETQPDVPYPYSQLQLVRIHILVEDAESALDLLEPLLLEEPFHLTPGWLSIDPMFDPLRDHPRFQALLEGHKMVR